MLNYKIILATKDMCKELAQVKRQVWETTYRGIYPDVKFNNYNYAEQEQKFKNLIDSNFAKLYVVVLDEKIIGYTAIGHSPHRLNGKAEIVLLYLLKEFQHQGIGKAMFTFAANELKNMGNKKITIYCNKYNLPAQNFYKKMGCVEISIDEDAEDRSLPQVKFELDLDKTSNFSPQA